MKKIYITAVLTLLTASICHVGDLSAAKPKNADPDDTPMIMIGNYDDEETPEKKPEPAKKAPAPKAEEKKPEPPKTVTPKKSKDENKGADIKYKPFELLDFSVKIPGACDLKIAEDKKSAVLGEQKEKCPVKGQLGEFEHKVDIKHLVNMYKTRCSNSGRKTLYRRWIKTNTIEGYLTVCKGPKDSEVAMEANSSAKDINYQFLGDLKGGFSKDIKVALYLVFTSIAEK